MIGSGFPPPQQQDERSRSSTSLPPPTNPFAVPGHASVTSTGSTAAPRVGLGSSPSAPSWMHQPPPSFGSTANHLSQSTNPSTQSGFAPANNPFAALSSLHTASNLAKNPPSAPPTHADHSQAQVQVQMKAQAQGYGHASSSYAGRALGTGPTVYSGLAPAPISASSATDTGHPIGYQPTQLQQQQHEQKYQLPDGQQHQFQNGSNFQSVSSPLLHNGMSASFESPSAALPTGESRVCDGRGSGANSTIPQSQEQEHSMYSTSAAYASPSGGSRSPLLGGGAYNHTRGSGHSSARQPSIHFPSSGGSNGNTSGAFSPTQRYASPPISSPTPRGSSPLNVGGAGTASVSARHNASDARTAKMETAASLRTFTLAIGVSLVVTGATALWAAFSLGWQAGYAILTLAVVAGSLLFVLSLFRWAMAHESYHPDMRSVAEAIKEGSEGYLSTQYSAIARMACAVAAGLALLYLVRANPFEQEVSAPLLALCVAASFLLGAVCSAAAGYIGVWVSVRINIRVGLAASRYSYADALLLCFRGGAISAALSAQLCVIGVALLYLVANTIFAQWLSVPTAHVPTLLAGYGFGAAFVALFMQLGGGIYTKAADVGADMCGKIEANIPEDDARNPAVIADLVGDNVGDCAGSMADVFESIAAEVIGTMILGASLITDAFAKSTLSATAAAAADGTASALSTVLSDSEASSAVTRFIFFPLAVHAVNLIASCVGVASVRVKGQEDPLIPMRSGYMVASSLAAVLFTLLSYIMLDVPVAPGAWWRFALCGIVGLLTSLLLVAITMYYTDDKHAPVRRIAEASLTGHGTNVISGIAVGLESCFLPSLVITTSLLASYGLGYSSGLPPVQAGIYGAAIATMGMLSTAVYVLSMNNFGPIADNAGGIVEMSESPAGCRAITDRLDSVGNVTKAASKGYAVGGSALACFVLFQAFLDEISILTKQILQVNLAKVECICGGMLAIAMIFVFAGWSMEAVGRTAQQVVLEVRRQFQARPGIMDGTQRPEYGRCVTIVTQAALREMARPAILALLGPIVVGVVFKMIGAWTGSPLLGVEVLATFLLFGTLTGLLMAVFMDNAGGAWDNAKKLIESEGKKGTDQHKAAVTGDTVGDPFKDTAGPSLHVIITTMSTTILVLGPLFLGSEVQ